jgi:hypothetical protein
MIKTLSAAMLSGLVVLAAPGWAGDVHQPLELPSVQGGATNSCPQPGAAQGQVTGGGAGNQAAAGAMMGSGPMPMMSMMTDHIEGRLAFLKAELKISESQLPQWKAFAEAVHASAKSMSGMPASMMEARALPLPQRIEATEKGMSLRLDALRKIGAAVGPLYASLSPEQKRIADSLMVSPMGMLDMM